MAIAIWKCGAACAISLACISTAQAERANFYTIIGPDGQMIVIDRNAASEQPKMASGDQPAKRRWSLFGKKSNGEKSVGAAVDSAAPSVTVPVQTAKNSSVTPPSRVQVQPNLVNLPRVDPPFESQLSNSGKPATPDTVGQNNTVPSKREADSSLGNSTSITQNGNNDNKVKQFVTPITVPTVRQPLNNTNQTAAVQSGQDKDRNGNPVTVIDGEQYIDSEYLEQREFNLEGKKRFYNLPDGLGGREIIEREKGVDMTVFRKQTIDQPTQVVTLAKNYQRMPQAQVVELTGIQCFTPKQLEKAKPMSANEAVNFWPRPGFEPKFDFVLAKLEQPINDIQLLSYANTSNNPRFYWPLPIFLDEKGCVIEGVNSFYQDTIAPTVTMHQALQGYLHLPPATKYILLTPLETAADLSETQLTNKGQVRLTPIR